MKLPPMAEGCRGREKRWKKNLRPKNVVNGDEREDTVKEKKKRQCSLMWLVAGMRVTIIAFRQGLG